MMRKVRAQDLKKGDVLRGSAGDHSVISVSHDASVVYLCTRVGGRNTVLSKVGKGKLVTVTK